MIDFQGQSTTGGGRIRSFLPNQAPIVGQPQATPPAVNHRRLFESEAALDKRLRQQMQQAQNLSQYTDPARLSQLELLANSFARQTGSPRPYQDRWSRYDLSRLGEFRLMQGQYENAVSNYLKKQTGYGSIKDIQRAAPVAIQQAGEAASQERGRYYENLIRGGYTPPPSGGERDIGTFYG